MTKRQVWLQAKGRTSLDVHVTYPARGPGAPAVAARRSNARAPTPKWSPHAQDVNYVSRSAGVLLVVLTLPAVENQEELDELADVLFGELHRGFTCCRHGGRSGFMINGAVLRPSHDGIIAGRSSTSV